MKQSFRYIIFILFFCLALPVHASIFNGTINAADSTALLCGNDVCTTASEINFLTTNGIEVQITDTAVTGDIWSTDMGWINLNPSQSGVTNTENGILSGYAWGENTGWINFAPAYGGVTINDSGQFSGWAWAENAGWIEFNCSIANACVQTDWRPVGVRPHPAPIFSSPSITPTITPTPTIVPPPPTTLELQPTIYNTSGEVTPTYAPAKVKPVKISPPPTAIKPNVPAPPSFPPIPNITPVNTQQPQTGFLPGVFHFIGKVANNFRNFIFSIFRFSRF